MNPTLASIICACGIAGLFYLDRDKTIRTSKALWLPVVYLWILGGRPVSFWLGVNQPSGSDAQLDGSPIDAAVYAILAATAIGVLIYRSNRTRILLQKNWPILIYFFFCLISVVWSYHPDIALKRWTKAIGDLAMVLVIATDAHPVAALRRLISRVGFVLLPMSVLFIKYYGYLGRGYSPDGAPMNTGTTTNKNMLGALLLVTSLFTLWRIIILWRAKSQPNRSRHLLAQCTLLVFGIALLQMADSQTSVACFILGAGLIIATSLRAFRHSPARVQLLCLALLLAGVLTLLLGGQGGVASALGRQSSLSGRTDIWTALIAATRHPILGAGFESFWIGPDEVTFQHSLALLGWWHPEGLNEAHNGYLEVYLELGWVGVGLISYLLISGYRRAVAAFRLNPPIGGLMLAYVIAFAFYNITEAGFRMMSETWIFLLLAIISSTGVTSGLYGRTAKVSTKNGDTARGRQAGNRLGQREAAYTFTRAGV